MKFVVCVRHRLPLRLHFIKLICAGREVTASISTPFLVFRSCNLLFDIRLVLNRTRALKLIFHLFLICCGRASKQRHSPYGMPSYQHPPRRHAMRQYDIQTRNAIELFIDQSKLSASNSQSYVVVTVAANAQRYVINDTNEMKA